MLGTRYEDYSSLEGKLPFKLVIDRRVTPDTYSPEANWHDNLELQLCTDGKGYVTLGEKNLPFEKGDLIAVNSNIIHHTNSSHSVTYSCLIIDTDFCRQMDIDPTKLNFSPRICNANLIGLFDELISAYKKTEDICYTARLCGIIVKILIELREKHTVSESLGEISSRAFENVKGAIRFIRSNYEKKICLDEVARSVFTDKFTLSREFKRITNQTIVEYTNSYRCGKAAELIGDGMPVSDAARSCGFTNMSFFTRTFKLYMGCLPSKYKRTIN